jgi:hypothetical protein
MAPLTIRGSGQNDVAETREHAGMACFSIETPLLLTEMLDLLRHCFHCLRLQSIEARFHKRPSQ